MGNFIHLSLPRKMPPSCNCLSPKHDIINKIFQICLSVSPLQEQPVGLAAGAMLSVSAPTIPSHHGHSLVLDVEWWCCCCWGCGKLALPYGDVFSINI